MSDFDLIPTLRKIEAVSASLELRARWIAEDVNNLVNLPSWETKAEDGLLAAEQRLRRTLQVVEQARALMLRKRPQAAA